jgi:hypothetical protein
MSYVRKNLDEMRASNRHGQVSEVRVAKLLRDAGRTVKQMPYGAPFDLLVDGWKVDVKASQMTIGGAKSGRSGMPLWAFVINRFKRDDEPCDFYILRLEDVPYRSRKPLHLLLPAPLRTARLVIGFSALLSRYAYASVEFRDFAKGKYTGNQKVA